MQKLNALALEYAGAILSAFGMLTMGVLGNLGIYMKDDKDKCNKYRVMRNFYYD